MIYTKYSHVTGEVLGVLTFNSLETLIASITDSNHALCPGNYPGTEYWFDNDEPTLRPKIDVPDLTEISTGDLFSVNVPAGTLATGGGLYRVEITDGIFEWETFVPGSYSFSFIPPFPYLPRDMVKVVVHAI